MTWILIDITLILPNIPTGWDPDHSTHRVFNSRVSGSSVSTSATNPITLSSDFTPSVPPPNQLKYQSCINTWPSNELANRWINQLFNPSPLHFFSSLPPLFIVCNAKPSPPPSPASSHTAAPILLFPDHFPSPLHQSHSQHRKYHYYHYHAPSKSNIPGTESYNLYYP